MLKDDVHSSLDNFWQVSQSAGDGFHTKLLVVVTSKEVLSWSAEKWEWTGDLDFAIYL